MKRIWQRLTKGFPPFVKHTLLTFLTISANYAIALVVSIIVARMLGPSGKGIYSLAILVPATLVELGGLGLGFANTYFGGSKKIRFEELASNSLIIALVLGSLLTVGFLVYYSIFKPDFLAESPALFIYLACLIIPFKLLGTYLMCIILGQNKIRIYNLINFSLNLISLSLALIILLVLRLDVKGMIVGYLIWETVSVSIIYVTVSRSVIIKLKFYASIFSQSLVFGIKGYAGNLFLFLNSQAGNFVIARYMNAYSIGIFGVASSAIQVLGFLPAAVSTVIFARTPGMTKEAANSSTPIICRNTAFITLIFGLVMLVLARFLVWAFFGTEYLPAVEPLLYLLPGAVTFSIYRVLNNELAGRGKPGTLAIASFVALIFNLILNISLIPRIGLRGAAIAVSVSQIVTCITSLYLFHKITGCKTIDLLIPRKTDFLAYSSIIKGIFRRQGEKAAPPGEGEELQPFNTTKKE